MTFILGLTGSIATGKSTVLDLFEKQGIPTNSADAIVHELYEAEAVGPVEKAFPGVTTNGHIDRQKLGEMLVKQPERLKDLEAIVHPLVHQKTEAFLKAQQEAGVSLAILEIPLLFETDVDYPIDAVAVTWCPETVQRARALARPGMTVEKLETILARQMPQAQKKQIADFVVDTGTSLADTAEQIAHIIEQCRARLAERAS